VASITLKVAAAHRDDLRAQAISLYATKTEAVHMAVTDFTRERETTDRVLAHRVELAAINQLIAQLGWDVQRPARAVNVTGDAGLIAELVVAALHVAASDLVETVETQNRAVMVADTPATLRRARGLHALLRAAYTAAE
jgi:hypothetical protein